MHPAMLMMAARMPLRALLLITNSMFGPGVADTTKVIMTNSHQVCNDIVNLRFQ
jgi:hypothetical protein